MFSESEVIYQKNKSRGLIDRPIYIPKASKSGNDVIVHNNKIKVLHTHCRHCNDELKGKVWKVLGICAMCDLG